MESIGLLSMFGICAFDDLRTKEIRTIVVSIFGIIGVVLHVFYGKNTLYSMLGGVGVGVFLYILSMITKEKIGKGDALIVGVVGIYLGLVKTLELLWVASIIATIVGIIIVISKREKMNYEIPFVPFLLIAYVIMLPLQLLGVLM